MLHSEVTTLYRAVKICSLGPLLLLLLLLLQLVVIGDQ